MMMINVRELRIGSIVADKNSFPMIVEGLMLDTAYLNFQGNEGDVFEVNENDIQGVPLDEPFAESLGFKWDIFHQAWHKDGFKYNISPNYNQDSWRMGDYRFINVIVERIQYVHQLQALVQDLTGQELTLKED